jgi:hypothetical protein
MVQTGITAPYGGGVFPPPVNGVSGVINSTSTATDVKSTPPITVKDENTGTPQQPITSGPQVQQTSGVSHSANSGQQAQANFSPPPPNGVDQQAIVIIFYF